LDPVYRELREYRESKVVKVRKVCKEFKGALVLVPKEFKVLLVFRGKLDYKASKEP
jgi:hypothetical protein